MVIFKVDIDDLIIFNSSMWKPGFARKEPANAIIIER